MNDDLTARSKPPKSPIAAILNNRFNGYALVGAVGTLLHWGIYFVLLQQWQVTPVLATTLGAVAGACFNYWLNVRLVFRSTDHYRARFVKFMVVALVGMVINGAIVFLVSGFNPWIAQFLATLVVLVCGFWMNARWTFG